MLGNEVSQLNWQAISVFIGMATLLIALIPLMIKVVIELRKDRKDRNAIMQEIRDMWVLMGELRKHINGERWLKEVRAQLTGKLQGALSFMPHDAEFRAYINIAVCGFIEYAIYLLTLDTNDINVEYLRLKFSETERVINNEGGHLLNEGLLGYLNICQAIDRERFYDETMRILTDQENAKRHRVCDASEAFVMNYLAGMNKAWHNFKNTEIPKK